MLKNQKKSLIVCSILSAFLSYLPVVNAQVDEVTGALRESFSLVFGILQGIFGAILDSLSGNEVLAKGLLAILMGIFFYSELKQVKVFKEKSAVTGIISFLVAISIAYWLPSKLTQNLFSATNPFIGFIFCCFILLIAKGDSNWSIFGRIISYLGLTISFSGFLGSISGTVPIIIVSGFVVASVVAFLYNIFKLKGAGSLFRGGTGGGVGGGGGRKRWYKPWTWGSGPSGGGTTPPSGGNQPGPPNQPTGGTGGGQGGPSGGTGGNQPSGGNAPSKMSPQDKINHIKLLDRINFDLGKMSEIAHTLNFNVGQKNSTMEGRATALGFSREIIIYLSQIEKYLGGWNVFDNNITSNTHMLRNFLNDYTSFLMKLDTQEKLRQKWENLRDRGRRIKVLIETLRNEITILTNIVKNL